ncbi:LCP family protein [Clostridium sp. 'White wine YQ']|uniref:LCP family protein n=1 Tax=Clostridium sp. 'White wine YQ' TaxID=3027474 RepID=UPI00236635E9|nr:LCP family protein [Clostridium sp. 'White wine YQ']MDD7794865.1 LCP family protein [Clostridium sp. 'White wine YQ']
MDGENRNSPINNRKKRKRNKGKRTIVILSILSILITFIVIVAVYLFVTLGKFNSAGGVDVAAEDVGSKDPVNILVLGLDIGDPSQPNNEAIKRTDTIMLLHYEPGKKQGTLVSVPRDMLIKVNNKNQKINAAYALGGDKLIKKEVENFLGINVNYIVKIDYAGFRAVIDAIGGIDMEIERNMNYDDPAQNLHIHFKKGETVHLDGQKAEEFFRWRKNNDGTGFANGDLDRIESQHKFINKIVEKCTSPSIIMNFKPLLDTLPKYIKTNMSGSKMISYGLSLKGLDKSKLTMVTLNGTPKTINGQDYLVYNKNNNKDVISALSGSQTAKDSVTKKDLKIKVLNGTRKTGLAGTLVTELESKGYTKIDKGNYTEISKSVIKTNDNNIGDLISQDTGIDNIKELTDDTQGYDAVIILGGDFKQ